MIGFRQQLSTTSFEAFELEITVNYPVHTWTENGSFMWNLTSWSVLFWLSLLTEHEVSTVTRRTRSGCRVIVPVFWILCRCFQVSNRCQAIHTTAFMHHTPLTDIDFLTRIASSCEMYMILFNFYWYLGLESFLR